MRGHETKRLVGLCSSKLLLNTKYSLMVHCSTICVLGAAGSSLVWDLLDPMIINDSAFQCNKRESIQVDLRSLYSMSYLLMRRTLSCNSEPPDWRSLQDSTIVRLGCVGNLIEKSWLQAIMAILTAIAT